MLSMITTLVTAAITVVLGTFWVSKRKTKNMTQHPEVDVEVQLKQLENSLAVGYELINNIDQFKANLDKIEQRRNQMKLLVDIHHGKLRVHRNDTGAQVPVKFN